MLFKKGVKSIALRLLGVMQVIAWSLILVGYFMRLSYEQTNKVSFEAAGIKYKEQFTVTEIMSRHSKPSEAKQRKGVYLSTSMRILKNKKSTNKNKSVITYKKGNSTNLPLLNVTKQSFAVKSTELNLDLRVLSSFDCVKSIPTVFLNYISNTFLNEYERSFRDFHFHQKLDETLPLLKKINVNCGADQSCSTLFQYDKNYGTNTTGDKTYERKDIFYCCPSVQNSTNQTFNNVCERAQTLAGKSVFRGSKSQTFLERVIELVISAILNNFIDFLKRWILTTTTL